MNVPVRQKLACGEECLMPGIQSNSYAKERQEFRPSSIHIAHKECPKNTGMWRGNVMVGAYFTNVPKSTQKQSRLIGRFNFLSKNEIISKQHYAVPIHNQCKIGSTFYFDYIFIYFLPPVPVLSKDYFVCYIIVFTYCNSEETITVCCRNTIFCEKYWEKKSEGKYGLMIKDTISQHNIAPYKSTLCQNRGWNITEICYRNIVRPFHTRNVAFFLPSPRKRCYL